MHHNLWQIIYATFSDRTMESSNLPDIWRVNLNPRKVSKDNYDPSKEVFNWEFVGFMPYEVFFHSSAYDENRTGLYSISLGRILSNLIWFHTNMVHIIWDGPYDMAQAIGIQPIKWKNICIWGERDGRRSYRTNKSLFCSR